MHHVSQEGVRCEGEWLNQGTMNSDGYWLLLLIQLLLMLMLNADAVHADAGVFWRCLYHILIARDAVVRVHIYLKQQVSCAFFQWYIRVIIYLSGHFPTISDTLSGDVWKQFMIQKLEETEKDPKEYWKLVKELRDKKSNEADYDTEFTEFFEKLY